MPLHLLSFLSSSFSNVFFCSIKKYFSLCSSDWIISIRTALRGMNFQVYKLFNLLSNSSGKILISETVFFLYFLFLCCDFSICSSVVSFFSLNYWTVSNCFKIFVCLFQGFPGGSVVKNLHANARDTGDLASIPGSRRSPWVGNGNPLQYSCLKNSMDREAWWATAHRVAKGQIRLSNWACMHAYYNISVMPECISIGYFLPLILAHIFWLFRCLIIFYYMLDTVMTCQEYTDLKNLKLHVH